MKQCHVSSLPPLTLFHIQVGAADGEVQGAILLGSLGETVVCRGNRVHGEAIHALLLALGRILNGKLMYHFTHQFSSHMGNV